MKTLKDYFWILIEEIEKDPVDALLLIVGLPCFVCMATFVLYVVCGN